MRARFPFDPISRRQPDRKFRQLGILRHWLRDGIGENILPKPIFTFRVVSMWRFRPVVVEWTQKCEAGVICFSGFGVEVGLHAMTPREAVTHQVRIWFRIRPDAAFGIRILGRMRAEDRAKNSPLNPEQIYLRF